MLTDDELDSIAARADRATPGPWESRHGCVMFARRCDPMENAHSEYAARYGFPVEGSFRPSAGYLPDREEADATAAFIAAARTDVPALVAEVRRLRAQRDMARTELAELREHVVRRDERRRDAVAALCEALGLLPR